MKLISALQQIMQPREWRIFVLLFTIAIVSGIALLWGTYTRLTNEVPDHGGAYAEGIIGEPRSINPILAPVNDADRDIATLVFDGLLRTNGGGEYVPSLAERYTVGSGGKTYEFLLRPNAVWHDGQPVTADDVVFTIHRIQDPAFRSPLRQQWAGVTVEAPDSQTVRFSLQAPYAPFFANTTVGILPRHIWGSIPAANFALVEENLRAIGSGPYRVAQFERSRFGSIRSMTLEAFDDYHAGTPFIETLRFHFYPNEEAMIAGHNKGEVSGLSFLSEKNKALLQNAGDLTLHTIALPRTIALFFNPSRSRALSDIAVRKALAHATNKADIVQQATGGSATPVDGPFPPGSIGFTEDITTFPFDLDRARALLDQAGWVEGNALPQTVKDAFPDIDPSVRYKPGTKSGEMPTPLEFDLVTSDWPELVTTAQIIAGQWEAAGVRVNLNIVNVAEIQEEHIRPRNYDILLFGQILGTEPDPFSFWHSSQKKDPGLNLAFYDNRDADRLLEKARQTLDAETRAETYRSFQRTIANDVPAIFLYAPSYLYAPHKSVKGVTLSRLPLPSDRFGQIHQWYIKTDRKWK